MDYRAAGTPVRRFRSREDALRANQPIRLKPARRLRPALALLAALLVWAAVPSSGSAATYGTGTFTVLSTGGGGCPDGYNCTTFRVTCSQTKQAAEGRLATRAASGTPRGLVMFFTVSGGTSWTTVKASADSALDDLRGAGFEIVQVKWDDPWLDAAPGETAAGPAKLACRSATVIKWVHGHLYNGSSQPSGNCGFCVTGESGGASQISYSLSHYGLSGIIDAAIPVSGPPHAALVKGCTEEFREYTWPTHTAKTMDNSYGFFGGGGPCEQHDAAYIGKWTADGVDTGGSDYSYPTTRVTFLMGTADGTAAPRHGLDYVDKLKAAGSPNVKVNIIDGMPHSAWDAPVGVTAVKAAILGQSNIPGTVPSLPQGSTGSSGGGRRPGRGGSSTPTTPTTPTPSVTSSPTASVSPTGSGLALPPSDQTQVFPWLLAIAGGAAAAGLTYWLLRRRTRQPPDPGEPA